MKALNNIKFVTTMGIRIEQFCDHINHTENWEEAKKIGNMVLGEIDCMITYLNTMIDAENNDFTEELSETLDEWTASLYQSMADKASELGKDAEVVAKYLKKRDEYR